MNTRLSGLVVGICMAFTLMSVSPGVNSAQKGASNMVINNCDSLQNWSLLPGDQEILGKCTKIELAEDGYNGTGKCVQGTFTRGEDSWPAFKLDLGNLDFSKYNTLVFYFKVSEPMKYGRIVLCDKNGTNANQGIPDILAKRDVLPNVWYRCEWRYKAEPGWVWQGTGVMDWSGITGLWFQTDKNLISENKPLVYKVDNIQLVNKTDASDKTAKAREKFIAEYKPGSVKNKKLLLWLNAPVAGGGPGPAYVKDNFDKIKYLPFDGLIMELIPTLRDTIFSKLPVPKYEDFREVVEAGKSMDWGQFTDNFVRLDIVTGTEEPTDWFDDEQWKSTVARVKIVSRSCKEIGLKGIVLDTEQYHPCYPFDYYRSYKKTGRSFSEYEAKVRQRGKSFGEALTSSFPKMTVLLTFGMTAAGGRMAKADNPYALMPAFLEGIMMAKGSPRVVDAFEGTYGTKQYEAFVGVRFDILKGASQVVSDPEFYRKNIGVGFGSWISYGLPHSAEAKIDPEHNYFSPEEYTQTLRSAMKVSDKYVWVYTEGWSIFNQKLPQEFVDAIIKSKQK